MNIYEHKGPDAFGANALASTVGAIGTNIVMPGPGIFAWPVWVIGIFAVGGTLRTFFESRGWTHWSFAIALGALSTFFVFLAFSTNFFTGQAGIGRTSALSGVQIWENGVLTLEGWIHRLKLAAQFAIVGGLAGLTYWKRAYRRIAPSG